MQVTPATWDYVEVVLVGRKIPHTLSGNVQVGVAYLRQLLREFGGDTRLALAGYVQGPRSVRTRGPRPRDEALRRRRPGAEPPDLAPPMVIQPPFP